MLAQLVGVSKPEHTELLARTLGELGSERAWVVYGADGLDELSTTGYTKVSELRNGTVNTFYVHPAEVGLKTATIADLAGGVASENAEMITRLLDGEAGARRDIVLLNAGAALLVSGAAATLAEGIAIAFCDPAERSTLRQIEKLMGEKIPVVGDIPPETNQPRQQPQQNRRGGPGRWQSRPAGRQGMRSAA